LRWLARIGGCEDAEFMPKLEVDVLQSNSDLVDFFSKDWDMSTILMIAVISLIITDRRGSLVVLYT
jgi:hypothetical protein